LLWSWGDREFAVRETMERGTVAPSASGFSSFSKAFVFFRSIAALMIFLIFSAILSNSAISESVKLSNTLGKVFEMQCEFDHQFAPSTELLSPFH
jgi:hypothetical protein